MKPASMVMIPRAPGPVVDLGTEKCDLGGRDAQASGACWRNLRGTIGADRLCISEWACRNQKPPAEWGAQHRPDRCRRFGLLRYRLLRGRGRHAQFGSVSGHGLALHSVL